MSRPETARYDGPQLRGRIHRAHELLEGGRLLELLDDGVEGLGPVLVVGLVVAHHGPLGPRGVDRRGPDEAGQHPLVNYHLVIQGAEERDLGLPGHLEGGSAREKGGDQSIPGSCRDCS